MAARPWALVCARARAALVASAAAPNLALAVAVTLALAVAVTLALAVAVAVAVAVAIAVALADVPVLVCVVELAKLTQRAPIVVREGATWVVPRVLRCVALPRLEPRVPRDVRRRLELG